MRVWGLYSSHVDPYHEHELIDLFASQELAETVMAELIGKRRGPGSPAYDVWYADPDGDDFFGDLHVGPLELRGLP